MEMDEITIVLGQASELHAKIEDAIERVLQSDTEINGENIAPSVDGDKIGCVNGGKFLHSEVEAGSLSSIRDALEVIEDRLDCLQILLLQQQADREAALYDLEECKIIFLERLRRHQGRERDVVLEALAFAGEEVVENDNSHQPSHPMLLPECLSFSRSDEEQSKKYEDPNVLLRNDAMKLLGWRTETEDGMDSGSENSQTCKGLVPDVYIENDETECKGNFFKVLCHSVQRLQKPIGHAVFLAAKTALVVTSVVTVVVSTTAVKNKLRRKCIRKVHSVPSARVLSSQSAGHNLNLSEQ